MKTSHLYWFHHYCDSNTLSPSRTVTQKLYLSVQKMASSRQMSKGSEANNSCDTNVHYYHSRGLVWSCWTSCSLWGRFLYQRCIASCHSCCRHHGQPLEENFKCWTDKLVSIIIYRLKQELTKTDLKPGLHLLPEGTQTTQPPSSSPGPGPLWGS